MRPERKGPLEDLLQLAARYREYVLGAYVLVFAAFMVVFTMPEWFKSWIPEMLLWGSPDYLSPPGTIDYYAIWERVAAIGLYVVTLTLILHSGRTLRPGKDRSRLKLVAAAVVSVTITAAGMAILCSAACMSFLALTDRLGFKSERFEEGFGANAPLNLGFGFTNMATFFLVAWGIWTLIFVWLVLASRESFYRRFIFIMLSGSWIEFLVVLPVHLASRRHARDEGCSCSTSSWLAVAFTVPLLVWAIGPAIALLWWEVRRRAHDSPRFVTAAILRKTTSRPTLPEQIRRDDA